MNLGEREEIVKIDDENKLVKIYWKQDLDPEEKQQKKKIKDHILNNYKGKLITDFRLTQDGYESLHLISIIPDKNFNNFLKELLDHFEKIRNYVVDEKEGIFLITSKEVREDGTPVCKITISAYPSKCKLIAQAFSSNLRKFAHGFCHV